MGGKLVLDVDMFWKVQLMRLVAWSGAELEGWDHCLKGLKSPRAQEDPRLQSGIWFQATTRLEGQEDLGYFPWDQPVLLED